MKYEGEQIPEKFVNPAGWSVVITERGREYGGPEEGGWWYNTHAVRYIESADGMTEDAAQARADELREGPWRDSGRPLHSVLYNGGAYSAWVLPPGDVQPAFDPVQPPRYE